MYNLKEKSWHYRLITLFTCDPAFAKYAIRNVICDEKTGMIKSKTVHIPLCPYVKTLLGCMLSALLVFLFSCFLITSVGVYLLDLLNIKEIIETRLSVFLYIFGFVTTILSLGICLMFSLETPDGTLDKYRANRDNRKHKIRDDKEPKPNIFMLYLKSIHNKICPLMKVESNV